MADADLHAGFTAVVDEHRKLIYKLAYAYCDRREDRHELMQEILIQLWRAWPTFEGRSRASTWIYRIGLNVAISHVRAETRRLRDGRDTQPLEDLGLDLAQADAGFDSDSDDWLSLRRLIDSLDAMNRAIILLYLEGHSAEEAGAILGLTATNITTRLSRIRAELQSRAQGSAA